MSRKMGASLKTGESGVKHGDAIEIIQKNSMKDLLRLSYRQLPE